MRLAEYLKEHHRTAAEFAAAIGVHRATVGRWIDGSGRYHPDWDLIPKIVEATGGAVTANDFADASGASTDAPLASVRNSRDPV